MVQFRARLPSELDQAMTLFSLRRLGASGEFITASGASDLELTGEVPDDKVDDLIASFAKQKGAIHTDGRHVALKAGETSEHTSFEEAEQHLGGPYTMDGATRAIWAYGSDVADHVVQALYLAEDHIGIKAVQEATGRPIEHVMKAVKSLVEAGTVRRFRKPGDTSPSGEEYGLAGTVRNHIAHAIARPA